MKILSWHCFPTVWELCLTKSEHAVVQNHTHYSGRQSSIHFILCERHTFLVLFLCAMLKTHQGKTLKKTAHLQYSQFTSHFSTSLCLRPACLCALTAAETICAEMPFNRLRRRTDPCTDVFASTVLRLLKRQKNTKKTVQYLIKQYLILHSQFLTNT